MANKIFAGGCPDKGHIIVVVGGADEGEVEAKIGALKGKHSRERKTYFSG